MAGNNRVETERSPPRVRALASIFWQAATRPSVPAAAGMLLVLVLSFVVPAMTLSPAWLASVPTGYFLESEIDNHGLITWTALRIQQGEVQAKTAAADVALIGGSTILHALPTDEELQDLFERRVPGAGRIYNLCGGALKFPDYIALIDNLKEHVTGAIVLNVSMRHLMLTADEWENRRESPFIGLSSDFLDAESRRLGIEPAARSGNYFIDHHKFLATRLLPAFEHFFRGPIEPTRYINLGPQQSALRLFEWRQERFADLREKIYVEEHGRNLEVLARMIATIREGRPTQVVLLESPLNPRYERKLDLTHYLETMREFAAEHGVAYWDLSEDARLKPRDFEDYGHVYSEAARGRFAGRLMERLAVLLPGRVRSP